MKPVLCVDLDGTLIATDLLFESYMKLLCTKPFEAIKAAGVLLFHGKARLKRFIAERVELDVPSLPYRSEFVEFLRSEKSSGRTLALASASDERYVSAVSSHLKIFDSFFGSDGERNLKGEKKRALLEEKFGFRGFDYAGNDASDISVWKGASGAIVVSKDRGFVRSIEREFSVDRVFMTKSNRFNLLLRAARIHQWVKNLLLFVPLLMAHEWSNIPLLFAACTGFVSFSLCASSVYIVNDLFDLEADRKHALKRNRPFASGDLSVSSGMMLASVFLLTSVLLALSLGASFLKILALYFVITFAYSLYLKRIVLFDIIILASLYSVRILAGGFAADVLVSQWLLAFSMFLFFSLACVKRYSEIQSMRREERSDSGRRGYVTHDLEQISQFGAASGYISILVLALYINSQEVVKLYANPGMLWLLCPILFYWVSRVWLLAGRGQMHEDPIVFALQDATSYLVGLLSIIVILISL